MALEMIADGDLCRVTVTWRDGGKDLTVVTHEGVIYRDDDALTWLRQWEPMMLVPPGPYGAVQDTLFNLIIPEKER